jgi:hypothetical protein
MLNIKNKNANMLAEQTLKIIIAAMALLLLLYLLFALYSSFTQKQEFARAEGTLKDLGEVMLDARRKGTTETYYLTKPDGWKLLTYKTGREQPKECIQNCLCLCEDEPGWWAFWDWDDQIAKCNKRGVCKNYREDLNDVDEELRFHADVKFSGGKYVIDRR